MSGPQHTAIGYNDVKQSKTKPVAWFASNCNTNSNREKYVQELQKHIDVDIYGKCGPLKCPDKNIMDSRMHTECYEMLQLKYHFYLSFENIFCEDYVTEKVYNILNLWVVPVVMGKADYKNLMPPYSVINIHDFKSPKDLAMYLTELMDSDEKYGKYFDWKKTHHVLDMHQAYKTGFCDLCEN